MRSRWRIRTWALIAAMVLIPIGLLGFYTFTLASTQITDAVKAGGRSTPIAARQFIQQTRQTLALQITFGAVVLSAAALATIFALTRIAAGNRGLTAELRDLSDTAVYQERSLVETLMDNIPDHIYFKDQKSRFIRINKSMARRFKLKDSSEAVGKTDFDFFTSEHAQQAFNDEQQILRTGTPMVDREEKETWPDGSVSWVSTIKQCLYGRQGEILGTFGLSRDITARKMAEE